MKKNVHRKLHRCLQVISNSEGLSVNNGSLLDGVVSSSTTVSACSSGNRGSSLGVLLGLFGELSGSHLVGLDVGSISHSEGSHSQFESLAHAAAVSVHSSSSLERSLVHSASHGVVSSVSSSSEVGSTLFVSIEATAVADVVHS